MLCRCKATADNVGMVKCMLACKCPTCLSVNLSTRCSPYHVATVYLPSDVQHRMQLVALTIQHLTITTIINSTADSLAIGTVVPVAICTTTGGLGTHFISRHSQCHDQLLPAGLPVPVEHLRVLPRHLHALLHLADRHQAAEHRMEQTHACKRKSETADAALHR